MYQNTVPEEEDDTANQSHIPLGVSGMGATLHGSSSSGDDTGDIVGSDGHVERLPPYTRYADNVVAKGDMAQLEQSVSPTVDTGSASTEPSTDRSTTELGPTGAEAFADAEARKEGWREKAKRRKCCGIPCWMVVFVITVFLIAATAGGIIGGVIGNRAGVEHGEEYVSKNDLRS
jgi:hypothetical protein